MAIGVISLVYGLLSAPKTIEDLKSHSHGEHSHHSTELVDNNPHNDIEHMTHTLHQLQTRPWSALYVSVFFFMAISLGAACFLSIQNATKAGWAVLVLRIIEGITLFIPVGGILILIVHLSSAFHLNHIFHWMESGITDPNAENYDAIIAGKSGYLNFPFFIIRGVIYVAMWSLLTYLIRKNSLLQKTPGTGMVFWGRSMKYSVIFLVFFAVTSSTSSWDWIMSIEPHWFSTLFAWYIVAGMLATATTTSAIIFIFLRSKGLLKEANNSHLHDLCKYMFAFSIFWTYLWFSQFLLIWYSNIPEEVTYFMTRFEEYKIPFLSMLVMNFVFPVLLLVNADFKRVYWFVIMGGIVILIGHWLDVFIMIMPGSVGSNWSIGIPEIGTTLGVLGLFVYIVMNGISKAPLFPEGNPLLEESKRFHF
ncbi:quinol:cytochrome C oxidoreductase [Ichthyobacterium seriolicida]|nr:quinol:cytochrome C oxidoreductase [Ichthyobacterium seriolicida]